MLLSAFILIAIQSEHDCLEKGVDFSKTDEPAKGGDMSRLGL